MLDQVQKGKGKSLNKDAVAFLRKHKLIEGRINSLYLSAEVSQAIDDEAAYIKNKAFDDQYYKDMIVETLLEKYDMIDWEKSMDSMLTELVANIKGYKIQISNKRICF